MTMDVYSKALKSKRRWAHARRTAAALDPALDAAVNGQAMGTNAASGLPDAEEQRPPERGNPVASGVSEVEPAGIEPATSCLQSRRSPS